MSETESANQLQSISRALQGFMVGIVLVYAALVNVDLGGLKIGFAFLPVAAIFLWPRRASYSGSLILIFILGLFHDVASAGPLGIWTLSYLSLFIVLGGGVGLVISRTQALGGFILSVGLVYILALLLGRFSIGQWPGWLSLLSNAASAILVFPLIFWLRNLARIVFGDANKQDVT